MLHSKRVRRGVLALTGLALVLPLAACGSSSTKPAATTVKAPGTTADAMHDSTTAAMHDSTTAAGSTSTTLKK